MSVLLRFALATLASLFVIEGVAQHLELEQVQQSSDTLLLMPDHDVGVLPVVRDNLQISVERHGSTFRYRAAKGNLVSHSNWFGKSRAKSWVAYSTSEERFYEIDNQLVLKLADPTELESIAEEIGAVRAKHYPLLGHSIIWFRNSDNPFALVTKLTDDSRVKDAQLRFKPKKQYAL